MGILATFGADAEKVRAQLLQTMALAGVNVPSETESVLLALEKQSPR